MDYATWLNQWPQHSLTTIYVPQEAHSISTPLCSPIWDSYLSKYPNRQLVDFFLHSLTKGFCIGFDYASAIFLKSAKSNMESALFHAEIVDEYFQTEFCLVCVPGPFPLDAIPDSHVRRFGVIPKTTSQTRGS